jgi:hypothetical protein
MPENDGEESGEDEITQNMTADENMSDDDDNDDGSSSGSEESSSSGPFSSNMLFKMRSLEYFVFRECLICLVVV